MYRGLMILVFLYPGCSVSDGLVPQEPWMRELGPSVLNISLGRLWSLDPQKVGCMN